MNQTPRVSCRVLAITSPWSARVHAVARETHGRVRPLCYLYLYLLPISRSRAIRAALGVCLGAEESIR